MLEPFGRDIWLTSGPVVAIAGFRYPTRMAVIRLQDGGLFIWSPVALSDALRAGVDGLGEVRWLIAPNTLHDRFLAEWQHAYPQAALYAPQDLHAARSDLRFAGDFSEGNRLAWSAEVDCALIDRNRIATEAVFFHVPSRTILFTDMIQQFDRNWFTGWRFAVAWLDGMITVAPRVPRKFRYAFVDRDRARATVRRILAWPADRLVMAHGSPLRQDAQAALRRAFRWLRP